MLQEERYQRIRALLATFKRLSTERIADDLGVSRETARRDIVMLESLGELRRVHGGVVLNQPEPEAPLDKRLKRNHREKRLIARAAARLLQPGQTVFLDTGSTTLALAEELVSLCDITLITNGLEIAARLSQAMAGENRRNRVVVLGGELQPGVPATCGETTIAEIQRYHADFALLSPVGVHPQDGASNFDLHEAAVARAMAERAERRVILADSSKLGVRSRVAYCPPERIDLLVTDAGAEKQAQPLAGLREAGLDIVLARA